MKRHVLNKSSDLELIHGKGEGDFYFEIHQKTGSSQNKKFLRYKWCHCDDMNPNFFYSSGDKPRSFSFFFLFCHFCCWQMPFKRATSLQRRHSLPPPLPNFTFSTPPFSFLSNEHHLIINSRHFSHELPASFSRLFFARFWLLFPAFFARAFGFFFPRGFTAFVHHCTPMIVSWKNLSEELFWAKRVHLLMRVWFSPSSSGGAKKGGLTQLLRFFIFQFGADFS